jgi:hypothetical protein
LQRNFLFIPIRTTTHMVLKSNQEVDEIFPC